jgi:hypothetical protein
MNAASALKMHSLFNFEACNGGTSLETFALGRRDYEMSSQEFSASRDFRRQLEGYGLTTANILYRRPDHPWLLQTYIWAGVRSVPGISRAQ